ncbi:MAG: MerR family transcriptional regulator [Candidatus Electryonea clarkiae]|nr:MerR family transcriptional regulator [Candidatus Electryonea clarkiae]MDP8287448.1 MerR family transcriptional regulator [Candidatus Electryonea clarkiae]
MPSNNNDTARVLYSISQVNAMTGVGTPTIRKWENAFRDYLSVVRTPGGQRRFNQDAVDKIELLKHLIYEEGLSLEGARRRLEQMESGKPEDVDQDPAVEQLAELVTDMLLRKLFKDGLDPPGEHGLSPPFLTREKGPKID